MIQKKTLAFAKMEGLGNDYVYVNEIAKPLADPAPLAQAISDRHFGVGGDGLVLIGASDIADFRMRIFNADGSEAEMCGNATRCVGKYCFDRGLTTKSTITLETLAGIRTLEMTVVGEEVDQVRVDMGRPHLTPADIPMRAEGEAFINQPLTVKGERYLGTAVSMGNPHLVIPVPDPDAVDLPVLGPLFEHHPLFPRRTNTEFIKIMDRHNIQMRVWERGAGETLACGTGACAVAVAAALNKWCEREVTVHLLGGSLRILWDADGLVYKTGPARHVFNGEYRLPEGIVI